MGLELGNVWNVFVNDIIKLKVSYRVIKGFFI